MRSYISPPTKSTCFSLSVLQGGAFGFGVDAASCRSHAYSASEVSEMIAATIGPSTDLCGRTGGRSGGRTDSRRRGENTTDLAPGGRLAPHVVDEREHAPSPGARIREELVDVGVDLGRRAGLFV